MQKKKETAGVGLPMILWWAVFALATYSFSLLLQAFKAYTLVPDSSNGLSLFGAGALVLLTLMTLVYDSYAKEKVKGNVLKPFAPFDWLFSLQYKNNNNKNLNHKILERGADHHASVL